MFDSRNTQGRNSPDDWIFVSVSSFAVFGFLVIRTDRGIGCRKRTGPFLMTSVSLLLSFFLSDECIGSDTCMYDIPAKLKSLKNCMVYGICASKQWNRNKAPVSSKQLMSYSDPCSLLTRGLGKNDSGVYVIDDVSNEMPRSRQRFTFHRSCGL